MKITVSQLSPSHLLSSFELAKATSYLISTRDSLLKALGPLSESQWHFKPALECWSIAETLEHVVVVEQRVHNIVLKLQDAPDSEPNRIDSQIEEMILAEVPNRSTRLKAPPQILPSQRWHPAEIVMYFNESRVRSIELLCEAPLLRGHVVSHPILGSLDGYQWILAAAAHSARHTEQILEVKACPGFPEPHAASSVQIH